MRFTSQILLGLTILLLYSCGSASKIKDGETAYQMKQYATAIGMIKKEIESAGKPEVKAYKYFLLGQCYAKLLDYPHALEWYSLSEKNNFGPEATLRKAYVLKNLMKYEQAIAGFESLKNITSLNQEAKKQIDICRSLALQMSQDSDLGVSLEKMWSDSYYSDYSAVQYDDDFLVITSDREESTGGKRYSWTGNKYADLYLVDKETREVKRFDSVINSESNEGTPAFTRDYQTMIFTRCVASENDKHDYCKLWLSRRNDGIWSDPVILPLCLPNTNYGQPCLIENDSVLIYSSSAEGGKGGFDLWYAEWDGISWSNPEPLPTVINTAYDEFFPTSDGDTLYFSSNRDDGFGGLDIYKTFLNKDGRWSIPDRLGMPYNSGADDFSLFIDRTAPVNRGTVQQGYFTSSRGNEGRDELYAYKIFQKSEEEIVEQKDKVSDPTISEIDIYLALKIVNPVYQDNDPNKARINKVAVPFAQVFIKEGGIRKQFKADKNGLVLTNLIKDKIYEIVAGKDSFLTSRTEFSTLNLLVEAGESSITINKELELEKIYRGKEIVLNNIYYEYDKWDITPEARPALDALVQILKANPSIQIQMGSHTDCRGELTYNEVLSQKRAQSAVDYLVNKGIDITRLSAIGYGETQPNADCLCESCSEAQHQANRRTTFKIL
ncbi:MAG: OmpA family protein [Saprospiraceae bacterium]